jgi:predicted short-subunit dehydrogenase-like oxidoreductase (DUF2520 family)
VNKFYSLPGEGHWVRLSAINEINVRPGTSDVNLWIGSNPDQTIIDCSGNQVALEVAKNIRDACEKDAEVAEHPLMVLQSSRDIAAEIADNIIEIERRHAEAVKSLQEKGK